MRCRYSNENNGRALLAWPRTHSIGEPWHDDVDIPLTKGNWTCGDHPRLKQMNESKPQGGGLSRSAKQIIAESKSTWISLQPPRKAAQMNKFGLLAQEHWQRHAPNRYANLDDPVEYFTELGETISDEIAAITDHLQRQLPNDLEFMDKLGQMNMIRHQAEERVLDELVYSVEVETGIFEELSELLGQLPNQMMLDQHLESLEEAMEREAEMDGDTEVIYTPEAVATKEWAEKIRPLLIDVNKIDSMSEAQARDHLLALRNLPKPQDSW